MFGYLKKHRNDDMVFDPSEASVAREEFKCEDWSSIIYGDTKEELPPNTTDTRGLGPRMRVYGNRNNDGDSVTRR